MTTMVGGDHSKTQSRRRTGSRIARLAVLLLLLGGASSNSAEGIIGVEAVGITVKAMRAATDFYTRVLPFEIVAEEEVTGLEFERLFGVFGMRAQIVRLRLGEFIELIDFLAPEGRPIPLDSRSTDEWFQHIAIIVSDMDACCAHLRKHKVAHASPSPQRLPD